MGSATARPVVVGDTLRMRAAGAEIAQGTFVRTDSVHVYLVSFASSDTLRIAHAAFNRAERAYPSARRSMTALAAVAGAVVGASVPGPSGVRATAAAGFGQGAANIIGARDRGGRTWGRVLLSPRAPATMPRDETVLADGDTVRILRGESVTTQGILAGISDSTLTIEDFDGAESTLWPAQAIAHAEVQRGTRERGSSSVLLGAVSGATAGTALMLVRAAKATDRTGEIMFLGAAGLLGGVVGALFGVWRATDDVPRWVRAAAPGAR